MSNKLRGSRGKRGKKDRESRSKLSNRVVRVYDPEIGGYVEVRDSHEISTSVLAERAAKFWECSDGVDETVEDHIVPRQSLTRKQRLKFQDLEFTETIQLGQVATVGEHKGKMIGANPKYSRSGDKTLLNRGIPGIAKPPVLDGMGLPLLQDIFKRETSVTKRVKIDPDSNLTSRPDKPTRQSERSVVVPADQFIKG